MEKNFHALCTDDDRGLVLAHASAVGEERAGGMQTQGGGPGKFLSFPFVSVFGVCVPCEGAHQWGTTCVDKKTEWVHVLEEGGVGSLVKVGEQYL